MLNSRVTKNTNDLVYIHIKRPIWTKYLINFKSDQKHQLQGMYSYKKKLNKIFTSLKSDQNTNDLVPVYMKKQTIGTKYLSNSRVTKNTNDLVPFHIKNKQFEQKYLLISKSDQNTNDLVYVHILKK